MRRQDLPSGKVTFLFTDVEGSTRLLHDLGAEGYAVVLQEHRRVLREAFGLYGGVEVDTQGDAFFVAFGDAGGALDAAREGQASLASGPVRVRMGLHTGEPLVTTEGYVGMDVHRGARIAASGHGGQVLISETTWCELGDGAGLRDLGEQRLKDLGAPIRLFQLGDEDFPPLKVLLRSTLPLQQSALIGRERELGEAGVLLREHRVVTLTGPGGSGKTRLAMQLAAEANDDFPDGVYWVALQGLSDHALVIPTISQTVGAKDGLAEFVGNKRLLLLLDNMEQVLGCASELGGLLSTTSNLKLLATSREPLRIWGEHRYAVEPLPESDATALFFEYARRIDPSFEPSPVVAEICRRLDGLPLAIELAAARVSVLSPEQILERLDQALPVLTGGARDAPERQRTLQATIEWSYKLLPPEEQQLFWRLAVFAGSFDLEAAEQVAEADLDGLQSLVEKNLVRRWGSGRFGMLETIHEYATNLLDSSGEGEQLRTKHGAHVLRLVRTLARELRRAEVEAISSIAHERDNIRAALSWSFGAGDILVGLELVGRLCVYWITSGLGMEGLAVAERGLALSTDFPSCDRLPVVIGASELLRFSGDLTKAVALKREAFELLDQCDHEQIAVTVGLTRQEARAGLLKDLAQAAALQGDLARGRVLAEQAIELAEGLDDDFAAEASYAKGLIDFADSRFAEAKELFESTVPIFERLSLFTELAQGYLMVGECARRQRLVDEALTQIGAALDIATPRNDLSLLHEALQELDALAELCGDPERAVRALGASERLRDEIGAPAWDAHDFEDVIGRLRAQLGKDRFTDAWVAGKALTTEEALAEALSLDISKGNPE